jgi:ABC-type branched-subunit amino acid transport system substrate-binding protein
MAEALVPRQPRVLRRTIAIAAAMLLAACQTVVPRTAAPPVQRPPEGPVEQPQGPLPQDRERSRVALLVPITGPNAGVGQSIANAANLAVLDTGGRGVRITTYDTGPGAAAAAARAIAEGNRLFLGPLLAEDVRAVQATARAAGVPVIAFSNDESVAGEGTYVMGFSPSQSIARVVAYAKSRGAMRFAGLVPTGQYGRTASTALIRAAEAAGGTVGSIQSFDRSPRALNAAITRLGQDGQGYDAVLIADSGRIAIAAAPLIRRNGGADAHLLGTELWNTEPSLAASAPMNGAWFASVPDATYHGLVTKYRQRFGRAPYRLASLGYDAVLLTVRIARDWRAGTPFPARALLDPDGFSGVDGAFRFVRNGVAERALAVQQIGPGGFTVVSQAPRTFGQ